MRKRHKIRLNSLHPIWESHGRNFLKRYVHMHPLLASRSPLHLLQPAIRQFRRRLPRLRLLGLVLPNPNVQNFRARDAWRCQKDGSIKQDWNGVQLDLQ